MRLVCPNCEAKYEVPEDAIPESGRDVQCANCGHAWYQMRPRAAAAEVAPAAAAPVVPPAPAPEPAPESASAPALSAASGTPPASEPVAEPVAEVPVAAAEEALAAAEAVPEAAHDAEAAVPVEEPEPAPYVAAAAQDEATVVPAVEAVPVAAEAAAPSDADDDADAAPEAPAAAAAAGAAAYAVDDSVLAILREEADREAKARRAEAAKPLETQPDLGVDQAMPAAGKPAEPIVEDAAARRTRLPDVEEINSTLRPAETAVDDSAPETIPVAAESRSSFRSGFLLVLTVAILGAAIYGSADAIGAAVPALAEPLKGYVGFVDSLRLQLDGLMQSATVAINGT